jgi:large subunit ribosomal protein L22
VAEKVKKKTKNVSEGKNFGKEKKVLADKKDVKKSFSDKEKNEVKEEKTVTKKKITSNKDTKIVFAKAKYINMSARKVRLVVDLVRGKNALEAVHILDFINKRAALPVKKAINSAISNADNNFEFDKKSLIIAEAFVDDAPIFKRGRAGSRGRYQKLLKRNCHIIIGVAEK